MILKDSMNDISVQKKNIGKECQCRDFDATAITNIPLNQSIAVLKPRVLFPP